MSVVPIIDGLLAVLEQVGIYLNKPESVKIVKRMHKLKEKVADEKAKYPLSDDALIDSLEAEIKREMQAYQDIILAGAIGAK